MQRAFFHCTVAFAYQFSQCGLHITLIEYGESAFQTDSRAIFVQHVHTQAMKGRNGQSLDLFRVQLFFKTTAHFCRSLVGKCDGDNRAWRVLLFFDQPGNLLGDDSGLAASCAREHQQGRFKMPDCCELLRVEAHKSLNLPVRIVRSRRAREA